MSCINLRFLCLHFSAFDRCSASFSNAHEAR